MIQPTKTQIISIEIVVSFLKKFKILGKMFLNQPNFLKETIHKITVTAVMTSIRVRIDGRIGQNKPAAIQKKAQLLAMFNDFGFS